MALPEDLTHTQFMGTLSLSTTAELPEGTTAVMNTQELAATLRAHLHSFATGGTSPEQAMAGVSALLQLSPGYDRELVSAELNAEANEINDAHPYEYSGSIMTDDRANLFTNIAGYLMECGTPDTDFGSAVDAAIEWAYSEDPGTVRGWAGA